MNSASVRLLGLRPVQLAVMIIGESLALTAISLALGLLLGLSVEHYFATAGLDLRWVFKTGLPPALVFDPILYSRLSLERIVWSVGIVFHDGDGHLLLSGAQGSANRSARRIEGALEKRHFKTWNDDKLSSGVQKYTTIGSELEAGRTAESERLEASAGWRAMWSSGRWN